MIKQFTADMIEEWFRAEALYPNFHSMHEAYAVLLEELDEFWEQVRLKPCDRDPEVDLQGVDSDCGHGLAHGHQPGRCGETLWTMTAFLATKLSYAASVGLPVRDAARAALSLSAPGHKLGD